MSEFPHEGFQLDLALVEETLHEYLRTGDILFDNGEVFGIMMCSSGNQPLGLAFLTNDWEDTVYSLY